MPRRELVELKNVSKRYVMDDVYVDALKDVSFKIREGEFVGIIGPSGSGKSTLLNIMGLLAKPSSGTVLLDGIDVSGLDEDRRAYLRGKKLGFVFQTFNLIPTFNALENVAIPMAFYDVPKKKRIEKAKELLDSVGMKHRLYHLPSQLSGGERQRVAIARALANNPEIILADEPTGNLDSVSGKQVLDLFVNLNKDGKTIIIVTHDQNIAKKMNRIISLKDGRIIKDFRND